MQIQETNSGYNLQEKRMKRKRGKAKKRLLLMKRLFILLLIVATIILLALSSLFNINVIEVNGNQHYTNEEITGVINLAVGNNAFKSLIYDYKSFDKLAMLRYGKTEESITRSYPYIKEARVRYVIPGKVVVEIVEREPFAVITGSDVNLLVDREGYVLESEKDIKNSGFIIVNGIDFESFELGQALTHKIDESMDILDELLGAVENADSKDDMKLLSAVQAVNLSDLKNVRLLLDSRITVNIGDVRATDDLNYTISYLKQIFFKHVGNQSKGHIDFTIGERPRFIPELHK